MNHFLWSLESTVIEAAWWKGHILYYGVKKLWFFDSIGLFIIVTSAVWASVSSFVKEMAYVVCKVSSSFKIMWFQSARKYEKLHYIILCSN